MLASTKISSQFTQICSSFTANFTLFFDYTYNGKEKDYESGFHYYGSRYYSSEISTWLSTDPMADKYPSLTPYNYCANNPVKLIDPNGEDIWIVGDDGNNYQYKKGNLYTKNGDEYIGNDKFANQVKNDLNNLKKYGANKVVNSLEKNNKNGYNYNHIIKRTNKDNITFIKNDLNAHNGIGCETEISFNPNLSITRDGERPAVVGLAHELMHAYKAHTGTEDNGWQFIPFSNIPFPNAELDAVKFENMVRDNMKIFYRYSYDGIFIKYLLEPQSITPDIRIRYERTEEILNKFNKWKDLLKR